MLDDNVKATLKLKRGTAWPDVTAEYPGPWSPQRIRELEGKFAALKLEIPGCSPLVVLGRPEILNQAWTSKHFVMMAGDAARILEHEPGILRQILEAWPDPPKEPGPQVVPPPARKKKAWWET